MLSTLDDRFDRGDPRSQSRRTMMVRSRHLGDKRASPAKTRCAIVALGLTRRPRSPKMPPRWWTRDCLGLEPIKNGDLVSSVSDIVPRKCSHRGRKCSRRISGRPVWDRLFFRRVLAGLQNPITTTVHRTFHRPACSRFRRPSPHRRCARLAGGAPIFPVATLLWAGRKCSYRGRKCSHRISGRRVWDRLFFRRVLARLRNPDHDHRPSAKSLILQS